MTVIPLHPQHLAKARAALPCDCEDRPVTNWTYTEECAAQPADGDVLRLACAFFAGCICTAVIFLAGAMR